MLWCQTQDQGRNPILSVIFNTSTFVGKLKKPLQRGEIVLQPVYYVYYNN